MEKKIVRVNPCHEIQPVKVEKAARLSFCTKEQRDKLIGECKREDLRFVLYCGFHAGMRLQEVVEGRMLHLRKHENMRFKDGEERSIPMTKEFHGFLKGYGLRTPYMLRPEKKKGKSLYRYDCGSAFSTHAKNCGLDWVTPHVMRHTFASLLASAGTSIYLIAEWLGDDVRVVQKHYAKLLPLHGEIERAFATPAATRALDGQTLHPSHADQKESACDQRARA